jgi:uncharacterized membrane protein
MLTLIGILFMALGFAFRLNPLVVVVVAGLSTGWAAGMSLDEVMEQFGRLFLENRYMTLPVLLVFPAVGLLERHGMKEQAETLVRRVRAATAGRVLLAYTAFRQLTIALGVSVGGHAGMVRPLVAPMAEGAARSRHGELGAEAFAKIRAHAAAADNIGNFFGEDIFIAVGAILLMKGFFDANGMNVGVWSMALWGIPTALVAFGVAAWRLWRLDRDLDRAASRDSGEGKEPRP